MIAHPHFDAKLLGNYPFIGLILLASLLVVSMQTRAQSISWPSYGPNSTKPHLDGFVNTMADVIGPVDGSARLTVFTEGNHYPVLLPLLFDGFPAWCAERKRCDIRADQILAVTLPQVMIVDGLRSGGFRFGNAVLPVSADGPVFPDLVMGGTGPLRKLYASHLVGKTATVIARTRGLGLLLRRSKLTDGIDDLQSLSTANVRLVIATPNERGARAQYVKTLEALIGGERTKALLGREVVTFPGRLGIQHRDVPYALINGLADAGIVFGHLARFYADRYSSMLRFVEVPTASPFGETINVAHTRARRNRATADALLAYLQEVAPAAYEKAGFSASDAFPFASDIDLSSEMK